MIGALQGIFEWLPISSEGNITVVLTALGQNPTAAVSYALFLHLGTAVSATVYYRNELRGVLETVPSLELRRPFSSSPTAAFLGVATIASGVTGLAAYAALERLVTAFTGGVFIVVIGVFLVFTGILQRVSSAAALGDKDTPDFLDALLVGSLQGLAILPGVSRSGVTTSVLLFRSHDGQTSFQLSFLLSIPAALGGGLLAAPDTGLVGVSADTALLALGTAAVVGYLTIDVLMRVVRRVSFWLVCLGLGALAILGGLLIVF
ncbi:undecaprenyl-diphosphate phosphatase [Halobellus rarus]|uniref:Undecaprenyl-diphosphatase n=1 Tax=Halobellus rarus TaxID=1126237 RepID=A0ABD6CJA0_9EURY